MGGTVGAQSLGAHAQNPLHPRLYLEPGNTAEGLGGGRSLEAKSVSQQCDSICDSLTVGLYIAPLIWIADQLIWLRQSKTWLLNYAIDQLMFTVVFIYPHTNVIKAVTKGIIYIM